MLLGELLPGAPVEPLQLCQLQRGDDAGAVRGAVHRAVVNADQVPVGGEPDVALQPVRADLDGVQIGRERVLGLSVTRPTMSNDLGPWRCHAFQNLT